MATPTQNRATITAAIQAAATADLALLNAYGAANGASFTAIAASLGVLATSMSSQARSNSVTTLQNALLQALADFNTLVSTTRAAQTDIPVA